MAYEAKRIAIVDDNEMMLSLYVEVLALRGFRNLSTYSSGKEFLDFYKANDCAPPDIVFIDMVMDDMNGFQVLEEARPHDRTRGGSRWLVSIRALSKKTPIT